MKQVLWNHNKQPFRAFVAGMCNVTGFHTSKGCIDKPDVIRKIYKWKDCVMSYYFLICMHKLTVEIVPQFNVPSWIVMSDFETSCGMTTPKSELLASITTFSIPSSTLSLMNNRSTHLTWLPTVPAGNVRVVSANPVKSVPSIMGNYRECVIVF